jgi:hypothetical protein
MEENVEETALLARGTVTSAIHAWEMAQKFTPAAASTVG